MANIRISYIGKLMTSRTYASSCAFLLLVAADCPEPAVPANGKLIGLQRKNGDTIRYECDVGYELVGQSYAICKEGAWGSSTPSCNCKCYV